MCLTCGCRRPFADHGDARHITHDDLLDAAEAAGISTEQAVANLVATERTVHTSADPGALFAEAAGLQTGPSAHQ